MDEFKVAVIVSQCQQLVTDCARAGDVRAFSQYGDFFTEDAVFERAGVELRGREAIVASAAARPPHMSPRHHTGMFSITVEDADNARGCGNQLLVMHDATSGVTAPAVSIDVDDRYVRSPDGWRIALRKARVSF